MLDAKVTAVALAVSLILTADASASSAAQETPSEVRAFTSLVQKIDLADAVASAESGMRGTVIYIHFVEPEGPYAYPNYAAVLLSHGELISVNVDPITGIASMPMKMAARSAAFDQERRIAEALKQPQSSLQQAIDAAQGRVNGQPIEAWLTAWRGKPAYAIGLVKAGQLRMMTVDPTSDKVLRQSELATLDLPAAAAQ